MKWLGGWVVLLSGMGLLACSGGRVGEEDASKEEEPEEYELLVDKGGSRCNGLDWMGRCVGDVAEWCYRNHLRHRDCSRTGHVCGWTESRGYYCVDPVTPPPEPLPDPCAGQSCSGHGSCAVVNGAATCQCASGYHPEGLSCVADPPPPQACVYPAGPYGSAVGSVVSPEIKSQCYAPSLTSAATVAVGSFFDCDGGKHINAIFIEYASYYCGACQAAAAHLGTLAQSWASKGIVLISALLDASLDSGVKTWRDTYNLSASYVCDVGASYLFPGGGVPYGVLIDPRTMKIVQTGSVADAAITDLASKNGAP